MSALGGCYRIQLVCHLLFPKSMNTFDLLIIYFSFGSPFAVSSYIANRTLAIKKRSALALFVFLFWPGTAFLELKRVISKNFVSRNNSLNKRNMDSMVENKIAKLCAGLDAKIGETAFPAFLYEFRTILDRYVGLSLALCASDNRNRSAAANLIEISDHPRADLGNICIDRRNHQRLRSHMENARIDFIGAVQKLSESCKDPENILVTACQLASILNDGETAFEFNAALVTTQQNQREVFVGSLEKEVWTPQRHERAHINQV